MSVDDRDADAEGQGPQAPIPPGQGASSGGTRWLPPSPEGPPGQYPPPAPGAPGGAHPYPQAPPVYRNPPNAPGAVPALVLGILGLTICGLCAPFAWWQGLSARQKIDQSGGALGGRGFATAGYVMGIIGTVILVLGGLAVFLLVGVGS